MTYTVLRNILLSIRELAYTPFISLYKYLSTVMRFFPVLLFLILFHVVIITNGALQDWPKSPSKMVAGSGLNKNQYSTSNSAMKYGSGILENVEYHINNHDRDESSNHVFQGSISGTSSSSKTKSVGAHAGSYGSYKRYSNGLSESTLKELYAETGASASTTSLQAGAHATAGLAKVEGRYSVFKGHVRGPEVGVYAGAGLQQTGIGARATLGEAGGDIGGIIGAKIGLSADTVAGIGAQGVELKVLGTGASIGPTGISLCLFGSCLSIG